MDDTTGRTLTLNGTPAVDGPDLRKVRDRVIEIAGRLAAIDERYAGWAKAVGVPVGSVTTDKDKDDLICELDALVSLLYGLDRSQVRQVFASFHRGWDYQPRLTTVLKHYDQWTSRLPRGA